MIRNRVRKNDDNTRPFRSRTVTLDAGKTKTIPLGKYNKTPAEGDFLISVSSGTEDTLGKSLELLPIPNSSQVMGMMHLQNYDDRARTVTVSSRKESKS